MRPYLVFCLVVLMPFVGCSPSVPEHSFDDALAPYPTIALDRVTFSSQQVLPNERTAIATVLEKELAEQLRRKGYAVEPEGAGKGRARLHIDITYIWDGRLYGDEKPMSRIYPEIRLYAEVSLTDRTSGKVVLRQQVQGRGIIQAVLSPAPEARFMAPQRDLARKIAELFPPR